MDVTFNWPATTNFYSEPGKQCYVEFAALNHNISNARLLWEIVGETNESQIVIHVNDVEISSIISYDLKNSSNIFVYSMPELKYGDIVKFEIYYYRPANYDAAAINACLEYEKEDDYSGDAFWKPTMVVTKKDGKKVRLNADHINKVNWTTDKPNN